MCLIDGFFLFLPSVLIKPVECQRMLLFRLHISTVQEYIMINDWILCSKRLALLKTVKTHKYTLFCGCAGFAKSNSSDEVQSTFKHSLCFSFNQLSPNLSLKSLHRRNHAGSQRRENLLWKLMWSCLGVECSQLVEAAL